MTDMLRAQLPSGRSRVMVGGGGESEREGRRRRVELVVNQGGARWEAAGDGERGMEEVWRRGGDPGIRRRRGRRRRTGIAARLPRMARIEACAPAADRGEAPRLRI